MNLTELAIKYGSTFAVTRAVATTDGFIYVRFETGVHAFLTPAEAERRLRAISA